MLSKLLVITSIAFAINAAVVDPSAHTVQYESAPDKLVTEHYEIASEADTSSSRVINTNPHINSFRHRCNFQCNDSNGNYMTGIQQGMPNQACIFASCYGCDWTYRNCSYCRLSGDNFRDTGGVNNWCNKHGGTLALHNCDYDDGDQC